MLVMQFRV
jgi:hypothetical protein